jgi:predicted TIM-barrel fold metal-dependent hydrolase
MPLVFETLDAFGARRAMFASNFPVDKLKAEYAVLWRAFAATVAGCSEEERAGLVRENARLLYGIS